MQQQRSDRNIADAWLKHQRRKIRESISCPSFMDRKIANDEDGPLKHCLETQTDIVPENEDIIPQFNTEYELSSRRKSLTKDDRLRKSVRFNASNSRLEPPQPTRRSLRSVSCSTPVRKDSQPRNTSATLFTQGSTRNQTPPKPVQSPTFRKIPSQLKGTSSKNTGSELSVQPETRPISEEQLVAEVKGIYAGLVMVEAKCIEVDTKQGALTSLGPGMSSHTKLGDTQWQALIALHRTLLHEHHDFFLASQHPSASPSLKRLASKYAMPARMWRHGIHSFLELLRHRMPASLDHMLAFIYLAYSMTALLYETVPNFEDTWIECLGDLGRYRMAIEDDDIKDREAWTAVARRWYLKASNNTSTTGRLYHHLAILARPKTLQQLFYYSRSLRVAIPFTSARESILTLFHPMLNTDSSQGESRIPIPEVSFVQAHGILFMKIDNEEFESLANEWLELLDHHKGSVTRKFMEQGYHIAVANMAAILDNICGESVAMHNIYYQKESTFQNLEYLTRKKTTASFKTLKPPRLRVRLPRDCPLPHSSPFGYLLAHGTMRGFQRHPLRNFKSHRQAYLESLLHNGLNGLGSVSRKLCRLLKKLSSSSLRTMISIGLCQAVRASSAGDPSTGLEAGEAPATKTPGEPGKDNFLIMGLNLAECVVLFVLYLAIRACNKPLRQRAANEIEGYSVLFWLTVASVSAALFLGMDERVSTSALAPVCAFGLGLIAQYHGKKLAPFKATAATTGFLTVVVDLLIVEAIRQVSPEFEGRYNNIWTFHMVVDLPVAMILVWLWELFIVQPGHAQRFENAFAEPLLPTSNSSN